MSAHRLSIAAPPFVLALAILLTACGHKKNYEYAIPDEICGVPIDRDALTAVIPPGDELELDPGDSDLFSHECTVAVDSKHILDVDVLRPSRPPNLEERATNSTVIEEFEALDVIDSGIVWENGAMVTWECHSENSGIDQRFVDADVNIYHDHAGSGDERLANIETFARSYTDGLRAYLECDVS